VFAGEGLAELTLDGDRTALNCGGDAANAAVMCARLGGNARLLGRVGGDPLGRRLLRAWRETGVDVSRLIVDVGAPTGLYVHELSREPGAVPRAFTYWRRDSAGSRWCPADLDDSDALSAVSALVVTGVTMTVSDSSAAAAWKAIAEARAAAVPVACILNYRPALSPDADVLSRIAVTADILIASVEDLANAFPTWSPVEIFELIQEPGHELVLTAGHVGAAVRSSEGSARQLAPAVPARDTVGAGDALAGAYLWARFQRNQPPAEALAWGVAAASLSVQAEGCTSSYPDVEQTARARETLPPLEADAADEWLGVHMRTGRSP